jgi:nitrite reductase/ring-hydroxylating ferredoxin subunit
MSSRGHEGDGDAGEWTIAIALDELWEGEMVGLRLGAADVLLVNLGKAEVHAFDNRCPHAGSRLSEGHLQANVIQCGAHLWQFDARSGLGVNPRNCALRRYPVKVVDGAILVRVGAHP